MAFTPAESRFRTNRRGIDGFKRGCRKKYIKLNGYGSIKMEVSKNEQINRKEYQLDVVFKINHLSGFEQV